MENNNSRDFLDHLISPDQRSETWNGERIGRFTSSEVYRLMTTVYDKREMTDEEKRQRPASGKRSATNFIYTENASALSDGAISYVDQKVVEMITGIWYPSYGMAVQWGEDKEPEAKRHFQEVTGLQIVEKQFIPFLTFGGGSPDGDLPEIDAVLEIKCPFESANQLRYFKELNSAADLKELWPEYYWQCQANALWLKRRNIVFATFDPRMPDEYKMRILPFEADPIDQKRMLEKMDIAAKLRDEKFNELTKTTKWHRSQKIIIPASPTLNDGSQKKPSKKSRKSTT